MHTPTQKQWKTVIDKFYSVLPFSLQEGSGLKMTTPFVKNKFTECGTIHCVGGWYAIAHWHEEAFNEARTLGFVDGAHQMARDLGFCDMHDLALWANNSPYLWGNIHGLNMFYISAAYNGASDLAGVIQHLERVADNCKKVKP